MPSHDKTPNMKLVMNPEGKVHDWTELEDREQLPEIMQHVSSRARQRRDTKQEQKGAAKPSQDLV